MCVKRSSLSISEFRDLEFWGFTNKSDKHIFILLINIVQVNKTETGNYVRESQMLGSKILWEDGWRDLQFKESTQNDGKNSQGRRSNPAVADLEVPG